MSKIQDVPILGIVIPTLGSRDDYLKQCIKSIRASALQVHICLVAPSDFLNLDVTRQLDVDQFVVDEGVGLPAAINKGIEDLPESVMYVNWLGDDDLLRTNSMDLALEVLIAHPGATFVYGSCDYIDGDGRVLLTSRSGKWARLVMRFGPQLVPQPGALIPRVAFEKIGGLNEKYRWAFDLDMFIRLSKVGKPFYLKEVVSAFRWHGDSLSVGGRRGSVNEASYIRVQHMPRWLRPATILWEPISRLVIFHTGRVLSAKSGVISR